MQLIPPTLTYLNQRAYPTTEVSDNPLQGEFLPIGYIEDGHRYVGGDPLKDESWEKIEASEKTTEKMLPHQKALYYGAPVFEGLTLGWGNELAGHGQKMAGLPEEASKAADEYVGGIVNQRFEDAPVSSGLTAAVSGALNPVGWGVTPFRALSQTGRTLTGQMPTQARMLGIPMHGGAVGKTASDVSRAIANPYGMAMVEGGVAGAGVSEDNRSLGAAGGALLGGAGTALVRGAAHVLPSVRRATKRRFAKKKATEEVEAALEMAGPRQSLDSPEDVVSGPMTTKEVSERVGEGVPADASAELAHIGKTAAQPIGEGRKIATEALSQRQFDRLSQVGDDIKGILDVDKSPFEWRQQIKNERGQLRNPYEQIYSTPVESTEKLWGIINKLDDPNVGVLRDVLKQANKEATLQGWQPLNVKIDEIGPGKFEPTMQFYDYLKHGLDIEISKYKDGTKGHSLEVTVNDITLVGGKPSAEQPKDYAVQAPLDDVPF